MPANAINVDPAKVMAYIQASSALGKRALDALAPFQAAEKAAADAAPALLELMVQNKLIGENQKEAAAAALKDPSQRLVLLKQAVAQLAKHKQAVKAASAGLGQPANDPNGPTMNNNQPIDPDWSLKTGFGDQVTSLKRASDRRFEEALGLGL